MRFLEFFAANIRNPHTRRAYARAADEFVAWCASAGRAVDWRHAAGARRDLDQSRYARACGAERQAAARRDPSPVRLAGHRPGRAGQPGRVGTRAPARRDVRANPGARSGRGTRAARQRRHVDRHRSARSRADRADVLFVRLHGAALGMSVEDVYTQNRRLWVRLREKGGKRHAMPCHHNLEEYLTAYLDGAGLRGDPKGPLFRTIGRGTGKLTRTVLPQANAYAMIGRRTAVAGIAIKLGNHSFRATGSPHISRMAARSKRPPRWRTTLRRARPSSTIGGVRNSPSTRLSGSGFDAKYRGFRKTYRKRTFWSSTDASCSSLI